jgi:hypothetical protein
LDKIIEKETELGTEALLKPADLQQLKEKRDVALASQKNSKDLQKKAEEETQNRNLTLGIAKGQNVDTPGTAMYLVTKHRTLATVNNKENPKALGAWGYTVDDSPKVKKEKKDK